MNREEVSAVVREVFSITLGREVKGGEDVRRSEEAAWDSLKHMEMLFGVEGKLGIRFTDEELAGLESMSGIAERAFGHIEARDTH